MQKYSNNIDILGGRRPFGVIPLSEHPSSYGLLIVDDDPELRNFLVSELNVEGYNCHEASTGQQALGLLRAEPWDLVLLDWTLHDFSGVEVCRRIRKGGVGTPVLMITARDEVRERVEALDSGADDYLTKPF